MSFYAFGFGLKIRCMDSDRVRAGNLVTLFSDDYLIHMQCISISYDID